ncbi:hypothetical protein [Nonomuraea sp. CA-141351]|uniref:hypothetical protein n=1 Tax=Nonomuraea sp. CA-141351 TaxID=3239996 RepID=UPI003D92599A
MIAGQARVTDIFKTSEPDVSTGVIGRQHGVAAGAGDLARLLGVARVEGNPKNGANAT